MVTFASARTRSWIAKLWSTPHTPIPNETVGRERLKALSEKQAAQKKQFLEASKNGGMWFS